MQKGQGVIFIVVGVLVVVLIASGAFYLERSTTPKSTPTPVATFQTPQSTPTPDASPAPTGVGETANPDSIGANWKTYTDSKNGFSLRYPNDWIIEIPSGTTMEPAALILKKNNQNSISVIVYPTDKKNLDEWLSGIHKGESVLDIITEKRRITIDLVEAERQVIEDQDGGQVSISAVDNGKSYQIITTFKNNKATILKDFDQILSTFRFD